MTTKKDVLVDEKDYNAFVVNKALSFHYDCIMYANQMNISHNLDAKLQNDFLLHTVRGWKRPFQKWEKKPKIDDLELVKKKYKVSNERAQEYLALLSEEKLQEIREQMEQGGAQRRKNERVQTKK